METTACCREEWLMRILISQGLLDEPTAEDLRRSGASCSPQELLRRGLLTKEQLAGVVRERYHLVFIEPKGDSLDKMALSLVPERLCREHLMVPLRLDGENIELLVSDPLDTAGLDAARAMTGRNPICFFGLPDKIKELITAGYDSEAAVFDLLKKLPEEASVECLSSAPREDSGESISIGTPVIRLADILIAQAVRLRASDIHIEHDEHTSMVRYRIDGDLRNIMSLPKHIGQGPLVSRIKIMAELDVADRRRPQDGRAKLKVGMEEIGLRISTMPTAFGEKAVLRILDRRRAEVPLGSLGYRPEILGCLERLSESSQGLLLVTGPTGSGKTTALYSMIHRLKSEDINIVTVEDPIEYRLEGINQIQVNAKAGMDFATVLRSVLRQDPDVVLVGEIRDRETADIAFQAALTGHLVFSTLHTNDAVSTISRLIDMGVARYKIAPALIGVSSQRLVRRICADCKEESAPDLALAARLSQAGLAPRLFQGKGCSRCGGTGISGRIAVTELLDLSEQEARDVLASNQDSAAFRDEAVRRGWLKGMAEDALWHLSCGNASLEDLAPYLGLGQAPHAPAPRPEGAAAGAAVPSVTSGSAERKILIVDDDPQNRLLIRTTLKAEGHLFIEAESGAAALEAVSREKPELILLDLMMPGMDGFAVLQWLKSNAKTAQIPVMVLTAMDEAQSQATTLEQGADDYVAKPFNPKVLRARVKALFRRHDYQGSPAI